ncbi:MAG: signal peptidase II, partial [Proteobacteria bacterium]|nr:signal peptidase II [Pseudomonadota bacterium]
MCPIRNGSASRLKCKLIPPFPPAFNVADSAISVGAIILVFEMFRKKVTTQPLRHEV